MKPFVCAQLSSMARLQEEPGVPALRAVVGRQILLLLFTHLHAQLHHPQHMQGSRQASFRGTYSSSSSFVL